MSNPLRKMRRQRKRAMDPHKEAAEAVETAAEPKAPQKAPEGIPIDVNGIVVFVEFNPDRQFVTVGYDRNKIKTWDMVIGYLQMALENARTNRTITINKRLAEQHHQMMENQLIAAQMEANGRARIVT